LYLFVSVYKDQIFLIIALLLLKLLSIFIIVYFAQIGSFFLEETQLVYCILKRLSNTIDLPARSSLS
jgi:hypothetical protein